jgi:hypothetical protein
VVSVLATEGVEYSHRFVCRSSAIAVAGKAEVTLMGDGVTADTMGVLNSWCGGKDGDVCLIPN